MHKLTLAIALIFAAPLVAPRAASAKTELQIRNEEKAKADKAKTAAKKEEKKNK